MAYYNPQRTKNIYDPKSKEPFNLSRTKIEGFLKCKRCFYLDRRLGVNQPSGPSFTLNDAVDTLMKKEFDLLRRAKKPYALAQKYAIEAIPFTHPDLPTWRDDHRRYVGISYHHKPTNFIVTGIIDDVWQGRGGRLHIVDYKATSTSREISLEDEYKQGYKKQVELYQWLLRRNGFDISDTAYFVFANGIRDNPKFDAKLEFEIKIVPHQGDDSWVEPTILEALKCLRAKEIPPPDANCEFCRYRLATLRHEGKGRVYEEISPKPSAPEKKPAKTQKFDEGKLF